MVLSSHGINPSDFACVGVIDQLQTTALGEEFKREFGQVVKMAPLLDEGSYRTISAISDIAELIRGRISERKPFFFRGGWLNGKISDLTSDIRRMITEFFAWKQSEHDAYSINEVRCFFYSRLNFLIEMRKGLRTELAGLGQAVSKAVSVRGSSLRVEKSDVPEGRSVHDIAQALGFTKHHERMERKDSFEELQSVGLDALFEEHPAAVAELRS